MTTEFKEGRDYELVKGARIWPINRKYRVITDQSRMISGVTRIVRAGTTWDMATALPARFDDPIAWPSLWHDIGYQRRQLSRAEVDQLFFFDMRACGVADLRRWWVVFWLMYMRFAAQSFYRADPRWQRYTIGVLNFIAPILVLAMIIGWEATWRVLWWALSGLLPL